MTEKETMDEMIIQDILLQIGMYEHIYIYGAQYLAQSVYKVFQILGCDNRIEAFIVTNMQNNPREIANVPVICVEEKVLDREKSLVIIAVSGKYYPEIKEALDRYHFKHSYPLLFGSKEDHALRKIFYKEYYSKLGKEFLCTDGTMVNHPINLNEILDLYVVRSHYDKSLQELEEENLFLLPIQAGSALTTTSLTDLKDNMGVNISVKNRNYCECTAIYWVNANKVSQCKYIGFQHYRRRLIITPQLEKALAEGMVDLVLPVPVVTLENGYGVHYKPYIKEEDFASLLSVLEKWEPEYYNTACKVVKGNVFYPCNMFIMKNEIFTAYANWLFSILFKIEREQGDEKMRQDRYLGYIAEHLSTVYFVHWQNTYKIVHCNMDILM